MKIDGVIYSQAEIENATDKDGVIWLYKLRGNSYWLEWVTYYLQSWLWYIGIAIHNHYRNECTKDFNCCCAIGRKCFVRLSLMPSDLIPEGLTVDKKEN